MNTFRGEDKKDRSSYCSSLCVKISFKIRSVVCRQIVPSRHSILHCLMDEFLLRYSPFRWFIVFKDPYAFFWVQTQCSTSLTRLTRNLWHLSLYPSITSTSAPPSLNFPWHTMTESQNWRQLCLIDWFIMHHHRSFILWASRLRKKTHLNFQEYISKGRE